MKFCTMLIYEMSPQVFEFLEHSLHCPDATSQHHLEHTEVRPTPLLYSYFQYALVAICIPRAPVGVTKNTRKITFFIYVLKTI